MGKQCVQDDKRQACMQMVNMSLRVAVLEVFGDAYAGVHVPGECLADRRVANLQHASTASAVLQNIRSAYDQFPTRVLHCCHSSSG
jgi:hypothetical protein